MTPERLEEIQELYHAALERDSGARAAFLVQACNGDEELRREVASLLDRELFENGELTHGSQLGPYRIEGLLGAGGMGRVYKARDTRLGRAVAIKVGGSRFSERFQREARAISALNHPNVCTLYDVGPNYLVMELVEGPTLAERIKKGPLPLEEAIATARQIADGLAVAHDEGLVHRDLKPANIKIRPDGTVKILDFGLAKPSRDHKGADDATVTMTEAGTIVGTAPYMSPEQARGQEVDKRTDIWAFGVVLYEMLTGKRPFQGEDRTDTLARVVRDEPDINAAPAQARRLLEKCLEKDPKKRLRDISDAWLLLEQTVLPSAAPPQSRWGRWGWAAAAVLLVSTALFAFLWLRAPEPEMLSTQFEINAPSGFGFTNVFAATAISPDGRYIVFGAGDGQRNPLLWLMPIDSGAARPLQGTEFGNFPFWSPDSKSIGFYQMGKLKRMDIAGGAPLLLCDALQGPAAGGTWNREGIILFASKADIFRLSSLGGAPQQITKSDQAQKGVARGFPQFLPDGKRFLYLLQNPDPNVGGIYLASLDDPNKHVRVVATSRKASYSPPRNGQAGYLLWMREHTLMAQPFDARRLKLEGDPAPVAEDVFTLAGGLRAAFWTSDAGVLAYRNSHTLAVKALTWFDRQGRITGRLGSREEYGELAFSPDGSQVAVYRGDKMGQDLWLIDVARGSTTRLTTGTVNDSYPVWSPDGKQVAFARTVPGADTDLYRKPVGASGTEELLLKDGKVDRPQDWFPDGHYLLYSQGPDLWVLPMRESERKPSKLSSD